ncbi:MAG: hypothetical protein HQ538_00005 [Parcubacteria group bacterium]|nr:hypothetical protein [Parcubacteria group bacterium]
MTNQKKEFITIQDLLSKTLDTFSKGIEPFLIIMGIIMVVTFGVVILFVVLGFVGGIGIFSFIATAPFESELLFNAILLTSAIILTLLYIIAITFLPLLGQAALIKATDDIAKGQKKTTKEYFIFAWNLKWKIWGVYFLSALLAMVGFIFLIIPGIIIGFCMMFAPYILILENKKITECLKESFILVKDNFMNLLWKHILVFFAFAAIIMFSSFIPLANMVISFLSGIFSIIYVYLLYVDIKKVKSGIVDK